METIYELREKAVKAALKYNEAQNYYYSNVELDVHHQIADSIGNRVREKAKLIADVEARAFQEAFAIMAGRSYDSIGQEIKDEAERRTMAKLVNQEKKRVFRRKRKVPKRVYVDKGEEKKREPIPLILDKNKAFTFFSAPPNLSRIPTCELVFELRKREGVDEVIVEPYNLYCVHTNQKGVMDEGSAIALMIID